MQTFADIDSHIETAIENLLKNAAGEGAALFAGAFCDDVERCLLGQAIEWCEQDPKRSIRIMVLTDGLWLAECAGPETPCAPGRAEAAGEAVRLSIAAYAGGIS